MRRQLKHGESFCECFGVHRTSSSSHGRAEQRLSNQDRSLFVASTGFYLRLLSLNPEQTESITAHSGTCLVSTSRRSVRLPVCLPVCTSEREYLSLIYPCVCVRACLSACLLSGLSVHRAADADVYKLAFLKTVILLCFVASPCPAFRVQLSISSGEMLSVII